MSADAKHLHIPSIASRFPSDWSWVRLEDACSGIFDCPHSTPTLTNEGPVMVRTQDILSGVFRREQAARVSEETYRERTRRTEPREFDLVFSREGTYFGIAAEVPPSVRVCLGQRMVLIRPSPGKLHYRFLRYWLNSPFLAAHVRGYRDGSVAERLNLPTIRALPVPLPPLDQQVAIADVLGSLDDKIELGRQMNRTLERTAAAIFKAWFVDFEPVRAKAAGATSFPLMPPGILAALPASVVRGELGPLPNGWRAAPFSDIATLSKDTVNPGSTPTVVYEHFSIPAYDEGRAPKRELGEQIRSNKVIVIRGSVLVSKLNPRFARVWLPPPPAGLPQIASTEFLVVVPKTTTWREYVYCLASSDVFREEFASRVTGTSGSHQRVKAGDLLSIRVLLPPEEVVSTFQGITAPLLSLIQANLEASAILAIARDALLPKLLSGEVRPQQADEVLTAAL